MKKILLLDFDGVINKFPKLFSEVYSEKFNVPLEVLNKFFEDGEKKLANTGKSDLKEVLLNYLKEWKWPGTVEELLTFWFETDIQLDKELLDFLSKLKDFDIYLATDQEKYRKEVIIDKLKIYNVFSEFFFSCDLGFVKKDPQFFYEVSNKLEVNNIENIYFFDDSQSKVDSAKSAGINAFLYTGFENFKKQIKSIL